MRSSSPLLTWAAKVIYLLSSTTVFYVALAIFNAVLKRLTIRGSIVGTRADLAQALRFAADGQIRVTLERQPLEAINDVFERMRAGQIEGRIVLDFE